MSAPVAAREAAREWSWERELCCCESRTCHYSSSGVVLGARALLLSKLKALLHLELRVLAQIGFFHPPKDIPSSVCAGCACGVASSHNTQAEAAKQKQQKQTHSAHERRLSALHRRGVHHVFAVVFRRRGIHRGFP